MAKFYTVEICWNGTITTLTKTLSTALLKASDNLYSQGKVVGVRAKLCPNDIADLPLCYHRIVILEVEDAQES